MRCAPQKSKACTPDADATRDHSAIIRLYKQRNRPDSARELDFFRAMPSFDLALHHAANAIDSRDKRFWHQCRITRAALRAAEKRIFKVKTQLKASKSFDALHEHLTTELGGLVGVGELYIYDTALRLGAYLGLSPERVYLHAGARVGARALGLEFKNSSIPVSDLPSAFKSVPAHEIEDILCIYKDRL